MGVDIIGLTGTNVHWKLPHIGSNFNRILKETRPDDKIGICTSESKLPWNSDYKSGKSVMISLNTLISAIINKGQDPSGLGGWTSITLLGKHNSRTTVFTRDRPYNSLIESIGGETVIKQ